MNAVKNLLRIASSIEAENPILSYELSRSVRRIVGDHARVSVVNPGVQTFEEYVGQMVAVLKSLSQELETALRDFDDAREFAKFFTEGLAEEQELRQLLEKSKSLGKVASVAGFGDWFKGVVNLFRSENKEDEEAGAQPSYTLDESTIEDFVEGSSEWADASHYIEQEFRENKEFFGGADEVLAALGQLKESPTEEGVKSLLERVKQYVRFGERMLRGVRKHLMEPAAKITLEEDEEPAAKSETGPSLKVDLEDTVGHYIDALRGALGDERKTVNLLKELFGKVEPLVQEERGEISFAARMAARRRVLPALVRLAHARPSTRRVLLPFIKTAMGDLTLQDVIGDSSKYEGLDAREKATLAQSPKFQTFLRSKLGLSDAEPIQHNAVLDLFVSLGLPEEDAANWALWSAGQF